MCKDSYLVIGMESSFCLNNEMINPNNFVISRLLV
jgi:hypothetical protein